MVQISADLLKVAGQAIDRNTLTGLKEASAKTGVSFRYLVAKAAQESSFKTDATADTSSATGLFQFTRGTWLQMMKRFGERYGMGDMARSIIETDSGALKVADAGTEKRILSLREDPETSALMAAEYTQDNEGALRAALKRSVDAPDLYLAHFLGPTGASQLLLAAELDPDKSAATVVPGAAKANPSVFTTSDGRTRSAREVVELIRGRFADKMDQYAGVASAMAAEDSPRAVAADRAVHAVHAVEKNRARSGSPLDFSSAMASGDPDRMSLSWFMMEELSRMISLKPMTMSDDENGEEKNSLLSAAGFQGSDWSAALVNQSLADATTPVTPKRGARAYGAFKHAPGVGPK